MGFIQQNFDYDWLNAKKNLRRAVDLDPNNYAAHMYYGLVLMHSTPDKEEALREFKKAVDLDPLRLTQTLYYQEIITLPANMIWPLTNLKSWHLLSRGLNNIQPFGRLDSSI